MPDLLAPSAPPPGPLEDHGCLCAAVIVTPSGERIWYPCRSHADGMHHFAAHWPKCPAPWCRLPYSHAGMHDIPPGTTVIVEPNEVISHG